MGASVVREFSINPLSMFYVLLVLTLRAVGANRTCPQYLPIEHYKCCAIVHVPLKHEVIIDGKVA